MSAVKPFVMQQSAAAPAYVRLPWSTMFKLSDALDDVEELLTLVRSRGAGRAGTRRRMEALAVSIDGVLDDALLHIEVQR